MSGWGAFDKRDARGAGDVRPLVSHAPHVAQVKSPASRIILAYGGYRKTLSFGYVCLIYHATTLFCRRNYDYKNDSLGKTTGQMVGAARSAWQDIVEGSSRAGTSKETELRLYDVAKGSLEELAGDYEAFLIDAGVSPWSESDPQVAELAALKLDAFSAEGDQRHLHGEYILAMRRRFSPWLESEDPIVAANSPRCPECGGPMRKQVARKGRNAGNSFWSCCNYPNCHGTRKWEG